MASKKRKTLRDIEDLSNAFIDRNSKNYARDYSKHITRITEKAVSQTKRGKRITQSSLSIQANIDNIALNTRNAYVLGGVTQVMANPRNKKILKQLDHIVDFMAIYSVKNPVAFAEKVNKLVTVALGAKITLNEREKRALKKLDLFMEQNSKAIQELVKVNKDNLKRINKSITTSQSRAIIKERNRLIRQRVEVNGVKRPLSNAEISRQLQRKFGNEQARLNRILDTETHRQNELVREVQAKSLGFTKKIWNTQRDSKVRDSHKRLDRKKVGINEMFNVGGHLASHPGAATLPPGESINCRCFLTFAFR